MLGQPGAASCRKRFRQVAGSREERLLGTTDKGRSEGGNATSDGRLIEVSFTTANTMDRAIQSLIVPFTGKCQCR